MIPQQLAFCLVSQTGCARQKPALPPHISKEALGLQQTANFVDGFGWSLEAKAVVEFPYWETWTIPAVSARLENRAGAGRKMRLKPPGHMENCMDDKYVTHYMWFRPPVPLLNPHLRSIPRVSLGLVVGWLEWFGLASGFLQLCWLTLSRCRAQGPPRKPEGGTGPYVHIPMFGGCLFSGQLIYPKWTFRADRPWGRSLVYVPGTTQKHEFWGVSVWGLQFGLRMVGNDFRRAFQGQRKAFLGCLFEERPCEASGEPS